MDFNSIEIQIFVSCPNDVNKEKQIVKKVCDRINQVLLQLEWHIHLAFRDFTEIIGSTGKRPQQVINDSIKGYDIYLGILHMRFGTPTGAINPKTGHQYESGTEEEFSIAAEQHILGGKPSKIYLFFKKQKGCNTSLEIDQVQKVVKFKEKLMPNNWVNSFTGNEFESKINSLLQEVTSKIWEENIIDKKQEALTNYATVIATKLNDDKGILVPALYDLEYYIPRSITFFEDKNSDISLFFKEEIKQPYLRDSVIEEKRIVLLGNAGTGKSIELQQTAKYFLNPETLFIPVYKRFNTYINENIEDFLPNGWKNIDPELLLVLLDGLDEIQPQYFNEAVRRITNFSDNYPTLRIIISCRTNFYELPGEIFSGTLTNFKVYILNDLSLAEIKEYIASKYNIDGEKFIQESYANSYLDLIQKPFFLNILLKYYQENTSLNIKRNKIIEDFILSRIKFDQEHFKTIDIPKTTELILTLLEKVAFVMELTGKNYITDAELKLILTKSGEINQIKHFSAFSKDINKDQWMFEHNNIQEFLAARVLGRLSFEKLIDTITFSPLHKTVKPTWVNTISFFISIGDDIGRNKLIDWLVDNEPEIVVKFEVERVVKDLRIRIFKLIFNWYKGKNIWISTNKFNENELARFSSSIESMEFLFEEIKDVSNTFIVRRNAINILDNYDFNDFAVQYREKAKLILRSVLDNENPDSDAIHSTLYSMAKIGITDRETIEHFVVKYGKRQNQYVRAGLYKIINSSDYLEDYIDVFLEGLDPAEIEDSIADRQAINLADESWQLEEGIKNIKSGTGLKKVLSFFNEQNENRRIKIYHQNEIFLKILINVIAIFDEDNSLFDDIYEIYKTAGKFYDQDYIKMSIPFFEKTGTKWKAFESLWHDGLINSYKNLLLEALLDQNIINRFINESSNKEFSIQDFEKMHQLLTWYSHPGTSAFILVEQFEKKLDELFHIKLNRPVIKDWNEINKKREQQSFDLLFDGEKMLKEVENTFKEIRKTEINYEDLYNIRKGNYDNIENSFIRSALELLRDFTTKGRSANFREIEKFIKNEADL